MYTLIITCSVDFTVDLLLDDIGSDKFIRLNYDRPYDWKIKLSDSHLEFESETLNIKVTDSMIKKCIWRKPYFNEPDDSVYSNSYYKNEWKYLLYDIYSFFQSFNKTFLNPPIPDYLFTKHQQTRIARKYFNIARTETTINKTVKTNYPCVAKSMSGSSFDNGNVFFTTDVEGLDIDTNIWSIQQKIIRPYDLTVVFLYGEIFSFELDRSIISDMDWRKEIGKLDLEWNTIKLPCVLEKNITAFMQDAELKYGRFDFLAEKNGEDAVFLEVNRNGQWAWLDSKNNAGLYRSMLNIYDPYYFI